MPHPLIERRCQALEGLERILQVGDDEARLTKTANPYAALLSSERIESLEAHKSGAIAKRASRIWKQVARSIFIPGTCP